MHVEDRARAVGDPRRHAGARQPDRPPRRAGMEAGHARSCPLHRSARRARLQGLSVRNRRCGSSRSRTVALPAALPRGRGVRHHECDDAFDPGVVRQCRRHDSGTARFLSLAVGADRAAGGGLCRPAVLPFGVSRVAHRQRQHGRSDQHRRHARARHVGRRNHQSRRAYLFRRGDHAADVPAGRPLSRPEHAAADPGGRRKSRRAQGGDRDQIRRRR